MKRVLTKLCFASGRSSDPQSPTPDSWLHSLKLYLQPRILTILILGFVSGLPLALTLGTLTAWLATEGISKTTIGLFAVVGTPYSIKFLWSHAVDHLPIPLLTRWFGKRRSWILLSQFAIIAVLMALGGTDPTHETFAMAVLACLVALCSATQDIAIDAYRVEILEESEQGMGAAALVFGYRVGMLVSGAGALILANYISWEMTYSIMASLMLIGVAVTLIAKEPKHPEIKALKQHIQWNAFLGWFFTGSFLVLAWFHYQVIPQATSLSYFDFAYRLFWVCSLVAIFILLGIVVTTLTRKSIKNTTLDPFLEIMQRPGWLWILLFVVLFKFGDAFAGVMTNPFLIDIGFSTAAIGSMSKSFGFVATMLGVFYGGYLVNRVGILPALWISGLCQMFSNLIFILQAYVGPDIWVLGLTTTVENVAGGMGTAAFVAYLSSLCNLSYTATQYALLSSLAATGRTWLSASSGWFVDQLGWIEFFVLSTFIAIPGLLLLWFMMKRMSFARVVDG